jgi:hypothetical protein
VEDDAIVYNLLVSDADVACHHHGPWLRPCMHEVHTWPHARSTSFCARLFTHHHSTFHICVCPIHFQPLLRISPLFACAPPVASSAQHGTASRLNLPAPGACMARHALTSAVHHTCTAHSWSAQGGANDHRRSSSHRGSDQRGCGRRASARGARRPDCVSDTRVVQAFNSRWMDNNGSHPLRALPSTPGCALARRRW